MPPDPLIDAPVPLSLSARLRAYRHQRGMTQVHLALILGAPMSVVERVERDAVSHLPAPLLQRLALLLGCPLSDLGVASTRPHRADAGKPCPATPPIPPLSFGRRLRALRVQRGWSQTACARRLGLDPTALSRLECDRVAPPARAAPASPGPHAGVLAR
jgi:transcriptional regulator with XRE-family HTH domain